MKVHCINEHTSIHMDDKTQIYLMYRNGYVPIEDIARENVIRGAAKIFVQHMRAVGCDELVVARANVDRILAELEIPNSNINRLIFLMECGNQ